MCLSDFRRSDLSIECNTLQAKSSLIEEIGQTHPSVSNFYNLVSRNPQYKMRLAEVYGGRCAYCGVPIGVVPLDGCEIDHIICKNDGLASEALENIDGLENLALACHFCNTSKRAFRFYGDHLNLLSPDLSLGTTFRRGALYKIEIAKEHKSNPVVEEFYERMKFGSNLRRLDYLLSSIEDLAQHIESHALTFSGASSSIVEGLRAAHGVLATKRNKDVYSLRNLA